MPSDTHRAPTDVVVLDPQPQLHATIEQLAADLSVPVTVTACADVTQLATTVQPPSVVVVGPGYATVPGIAQLERQLRHLAGLEVVLAFRDLPDVALEDVIATGAHAIVDPEDHWELRATVAAAAERSARLGEIVGQLQDGAAHAPRVFTVCSPTGGCGKTFYASNLAYLLATTSDLDVALVDLDLQFGEVTAAMRVRSNHSIADAVAVEDAHELEELLPDLLVEHESGVWVLPAPRDPATADTIEPADVTRVIDALTRQVDVVVVDTPTGLTEPVLAALDRSDHLFLVAALDLASLRNLRLFNQTLERLRIDDEAISLVLNKEAGDTGLDTRDLAKVFPKGFAARIPFDREVARLMNHGIPVLAGAPTSQVAAALVDGLEPFLDAEAARVARERHAAERTGAVSRLLNRLRGRRSHDTAGDGANDVVATVTGAPATATASTPPATPATTAPTATGANP